MIAAYGKPCKIRLTLAPLSTLSTSKYMPFLFSCNATSANAVLNIAAFDSTYSLKIPLNI